MELPLLIAAVVAVAALIAAAVAWTRLRSVANEVAGLRTALAETNMRLTEAGTRLTQDAAGRAAAEAAAAAGRDEIARLAQQLDAAIRQREAAQARQNEIESRLAAREQELADTALRIANAERTKEEILASVKTAAEVAAAEAAAEKARLLQLVEAANRQREALQTRLGEAETRLATRDQQVTDMELRLADWQKAIAEAKEEAVNNAKAAVLTTAREVSSKLIEDHKRETETAKKENEERVKKASEAVTLSLETVAQRVASLHDVVAVNTKTIDTVWSALSNPGGAGYYAEIGLENTLKSFGLERGRDFVIQHTVQDAEDGRRLRPDAIVFLPAESVLVIDSKASKFVLDMAGAESTEAEDEARARLVQTMNTHLRALAAKDYSAAVLACWRDTGRSSEIRRILNVMYLPNEGVLERLRAADPEFDRRAAQAQIVPVGPAGLAGLVGFARLDIDYGRQMENQERIVDAARRLVEAVGVALGHADKVGRNLRTAADGFADFAASINKRLLPRAKALEKLGVRPQKTRPLPPQVPAYQLVDLSQPTIEGEAEEVAEDAEATVDPAPADTP